MQKLYMIHIGWEILKFKNFGFGTSGLVLKNFLGLFKFFLDPWSLRSPVVCKNPMSEQYFMPNSFHCRYSIPVHCVFDILSCQIDEGIAKICKKKSWWLFEIIHIICFDGQAGQIWKYFFGYNINYRKVASTNARY